MCSIWFRPGFLGSPYLPKIRYTKLGVGSRMSYSLSRAHRAFFVLPGRNFKGHGMTCKWSIKETPISPALLMSRPGSVWSYRSTEYRVRLYIHLHARRSPQKPIRGISSPIFMRPHKKWGPGSTMEYFGYIYARLAIRPWTLLLLSFRLTLVDGSLSTRHRGGPDFVCN